MNKAREATTALVIAICLIGFVSLVVGAFIFTEADVLSFTGR